MTTEENIVKQMLAEDARHFARNHPDWPCHSCPEFVLRHGRPYRHQPLPGNYRQGTMKACFYNSYSLMKRRKDLVYVEGYASLPDLLTPIHHAWCVVEGTDLVIDVTSAMARHYFGVPFQRKYVLDTLRGKTSFSLIDDWQSRWPLLQLTDEQLRAIVME